MQATYENYKLNKTGGQVAQVVLYEVRKSFAKRCLLRNIWDTIKAFNHVFMIDTFRVGQSVYK